MTVADQEFLPVESSVALLHISGIYGLRLVGDTEIRYVGQSRDLYTRYGDHRREYKNQDLPVYRWMRKHGVENIEMVLLESVEPDGLNEAEIAWIERLRTFGGRGLNCTAGGFSLPATTPHWNLGRTTPEETRRKISQSLQGRSVEPRGKLSWEAVDEIRELHSEGLSSKELSERYSVSRATINRVTSHAIWKKNT